MKITNIENLKYIRIKSQTLLAIGLSALVYTQETHKNVIYSNFEEQQPNNKIKVLMRRDAETGTTDQEFSIVIKNITEHKLKIYETILPTWFVEILKTEI